MHKKYKGVTKFDVHSLLVSRLLCYEGKTHYSERKDANDTEESNEQKKNCFGANISWTENTSKLVTFPKHFITEIKTGNISFCDNKNLLFFLSKCLGHKRCGWTHLRWVGPYVFLLRSAIFLINFFLYTGKSAKR